MIETKIASVPRSKLASCQPPQFVFQSSILTLDRERGWGERNNEEKNKFVTDVSVVL